MSIHFGLANLMSSGLRKNFAAKNDETIWRRSVVLLEPLLCGSDGGQHGQTIDTRFDARGGAVLLRQHLICQIDILLRVQNQSDGGCPIACGKYKYTI